MPAKLAKSTAAAKPFRPPGRAPAAAAEELLAWYERHGRSLPWRVGPVERRAGRLPDPYRVLLSEVMLQQTNVKAVAPYFQRFVERWPSVEALAAAPEEEVMAAWAGLGYYARARNLIAASHIIAARPGPRFPRSASELAALPGIGAYTSAAIAAIAFGERIAVVDGNVERVVARLFAIDTPFPAAKEEVRSALQPLVPEGRAGEFAEALMDLGATICTPTKPACALCPWCEPCEARRQGRLSELPRLAPRKSRPLRYGAAFVARRADGAILLRRRPPRGLLGGMSEVPGTEWREHPAIEASAPVEGNWQAISAPVVHGFTYFELRLFVHRADIGMNVAAPVGHWWAPAPTLSKEALPKVMQKAIAAACPGATGPLREVG